MYILELDDKYTALIGTVKFERNSTLSISNLCNLFSEPKKGKAGSSSASSLTKVYHCDICNEDLNLTSTEILKHKRHHMYSST